MVVRKIAALFPEKKLKLKLKEKRYVLQKLPLFKSGKKMNSYNDRIIFFQKRMIYIHLFQDLKKKLFRGNKIFFFVF